MTTPGQIAKFDAAGKPTDSIIAETAAGYIGVATKAAQVRTQIEGTNDPAATLAVRRSDNNKFARLGAGSIGVALDFDPTSVLVIQKNTSGVGGHLDGPELLRVTPDGRVGIGTSQPVSTLHVGGYLTLDTGDNPLLFTGTGNVENNRYLNLINSPGLTSASGLKAGGVLVSDSYAFANPGKNDLVVKGSATVHGDVILAGGDCAEDFDVSAAEEVEPGAVMVMSPEGVLEPCRQAYDKKVIGVISGAGDMKPGIILDKQPEQEKRLPVALLGKAYCKVDAGYGPIEVGDLLVTSSTPAHAMKASDPARAFGAVIGKALQGFASGRGLVLMVVSLV
jgi:hypothetical protein